MSRQTRNRTSSRYDQSSRGLSEKTPRGPITRTTSAGPPDGSSPPATPVLERCAGSVAVVPTSPPSRSIVDAHLEPPAGRRRLLWVKIDRCGERFLDFRSANASSSEPTGHASSGFTSRNRTDSPMVGVGRVRLALRLDPRHWQSLLVYLAAVGLGFAAFSSFRRIPVLGVDDLLQTILPAHASWPKILLGRV